MVVEDGHVTILEPGGAVRFRGELHRLPRRIEARADGVARGDIVTAGSSATASSSG